MRNKREYVGQAVVFLLTVASPIFGLAPFLTSSGQASTQATAPSWSYIVSLNAPLAGYTATATLRANGKIAFTSDRDGNREIYVMNSDGTNQVRLTNNTLLDDHPTWSPDGMKIAFVSQRTTGGLAIFTMNSDGTGRTEVTPVSYVDRYPNWPHSIWTDFYSMDWSPDGTQIVFQDNYDIVIVNADGSNRHAITDDTSYDLEPAWSPDGTKIVFSRDPLDDGGLLYGRLSTMNIDGSNVQFLPNAWTFQEYAPRWSPSGDMILFVIEFTDDISDSVIYITNADGSNDQLFDGNSSGFEYRNKPSWSPDETKILFDKWVYGTGDLEIYVKNIDGSGFAQLTNTSGWNFNPSWQPVMSAACPNPIDCADFFVRQHYLDFLNREPDAGGLAYWANEITQCGSDAACINRRRLDVSAAFFIEQEFQETGYFVYRFYKASYGRRPNYTEFTSDRSRIIVGVNLEASKQAFADEWVQRPAFVAAHPLTMSNTEFVNKVFDFGGLTATRYEALRQQEISAMNAGRSRALILRDVIEIADFKNIPNEDDPRYSELKQTSQYNPAFVLMQYFGYLRRDVDPAGYDFWLDVVNNREPNNYRSMVCAFMTSPEYQLRFGTVTSRSNADCGQ